MTVLAMFVFNALIVLAQSDCTTVRSAADILEATAGSDDVRVCVDPAMQRCDFIHDIVTRCVDGSRRVVNLCASPMAVDLGQAVSPDWRTRVTQVAHASAVASSRIFILSCDTTAGATRRRVTFRGLWHASCLADQVWSTSDARRRETLTSMHLRYPGLYHCTISSSLQRYARAADGPDHLQLTKYALHA